MSNFILPAFDPVAGVVRNATWIDDHFGRHVYGVQFDAGGPIYLQERVSIAIAGECIAALRSKLAAVEAYQQAADYYIDRLEAVLQRRVVRDMEEAMEGYRTARTILSQPSDYRERVRREAFEEAAKVADQSAKDDEPFCRDPDDTVRAQYRLARDTARNIASAIRASASAH